MSSRTRSGDNLDCAISAIKLIDEVPPSHCKCGAEKDEEIIYRIQYIELGKCNIEIQSRSLRFAFGMTFFTFTHLITKVLYKLINVAMPATNKIIL
jgi:hypothetical protein